MRSMDPARWDDCVLAFVLLLVAVPRAALALLHDRPLGVEGTLSLLFIGFALVLVIGRRR
ncbi:MAG TPA: hypothetical protein VH165_08525 [Kofleriaceae bacterium]|nr:hypothetical protein [Kofleriaceae bacterium]